MAATSPAIDLGAGEVPCVDKTSSEPSPQIVGEKGPRNIINPADATLSTSIASYFDTERDDFMINNLLETSDKFLSNAHLSVIRTNSKEGQQEYFRMVKVSIQSLLMLIRNYRQLLNPRLELMAYFKLAKIYFLETENITRADDYVNKAIAISTRNNLYEIKFASEFLAAQIIQRSTIAQASNVTDSLLSKYLDERISTFKSLGLNVYVNLFQLLKISNLMVVDHSTGLVILQSVCNDITIDPGVRLLCLLYQSSMHLYRGSPGQAMDILNELQKLLFASDANFPIQLRAMYYLQLQLTYTQTTKFKESKKVMQDISKLLILEQENGWQSWNEDGSFQLQQTIEGVASLLPYQVSWINSDEFVIMFYFLSGVNMIYEAYNGKNKSMRVFKKCLDIIEKQMQQLTGNLLLSERNFSIKELTKKKIKLKYLKYSINYYQVLLNISSSTTSEPLLLSWSYELDEFLFLLKNDKFSNEELQYFQQFIPKVYYLFAIYNQFQGNLSIAKNYFFEVLSLTSEKKLSQGVIVSLSQFELGIGSNSLEGKGNFNELYVYSLIHLLVIVEYEMTSTSDASSEETHKHRNFLYEELAKAFSEQRATSSNSFNANFISSSPHLQILYQVILSIYNQTTSRVPFEVGSHDIGWENFSRMFPIIGGLASYVSWINCSDIERRTLYYCSFKDITLKVSETSIDGKFLKILLLRLMIDQMKSVGEENDKTSLLELQLTSLVEGIQTRLNLH